MFHFFSSFFSFLLFAPPVSLQCHTHLVCRFDARSLFAFRPVMSTEPYVVAALSSVCAVALFFAHGLLCVSFSFAFSWLVALVSRLVLRSSGFRCVVSAQPPPSSPPVLLVFVAPLCGCALAGRWSLGSVSVFVGRWRRFVGGAAAGSLVLVCLCRCVLCVAVWRRRRSSLAARCRRGGGVGARVVPFLAVLVLSAALCR